MFAAPRLRRSLGFLLTLSLIFALVGCGSTPPAGSGTESKAEPAKQAEPTKRSIKHAVGTTEITGTPKRVVTLEWTYTEDLLAVGVQPVGAADIKNYKIWVNVSPELAADVVDVGTRQEPNLETIASLKPDLIIGVKFRHEKIYAQLSAIAPTLLFDPYPPEGGMNQFQEMEETFLTIADAVGKKAEGEAVLKRMNDKFAKAAADLKAKGKAGAGYALAQAFSSQNTAQIRLFTDNAMAAQILTKIGLKNLHKDAKFQVYGFSTVGVEALPAVQDAHFLYVVQPSDDVFANQLKENPVWKGLTFVKEGRTYPLGGSTWLFGGPLSAELFADKVTAALTR